jgi:amino acid permease
VENPTKTVPRALGGAVVLVILSYLIPLLVGLGVSVEGPWTLGFFTYVADKVRTMVADKLSLC